MLLHFRPQWYPLWYDEILLKFDHPRNMYTCVVSLRFTFQVPGIYCIVIWLHTADRSHRISRRLISNLHHLYRQVPRGSSTRSVWSGPICVVCTHFHVLSVGYAWFTHDARLNVPQPTALYDLLYSTPARSWSVILVLGRDVWTAVDTREAVYPYSCTHSMVSVSSPLGIFQAAPYHTYETRSNTRRREIPPPRCKTEQRAHIQT